ncbi:hypothetical protein [Nocardia sp. NPDC050413]|uniref:hypothetical protein n=1 Tax=Nocardia sp. NPDC050413 TaxID=3155784 RepID=UPI0033FB3F20
MQKKIGWKAAAAGLVTGAMVMSGAGAATAAPSSWEVTICRGVSPNIVDQPYSGQVIGAQPYGAPGVPYFTIHAGGSLWGGYTTTVTLNWTNLTTGASGSETQSGNVGFIIGNGSTLYFRPPTGTGIVRTDFTVHNSGFVPQVVTCSGTSEIV